MCCTRLVGVWLSVMGLGRFAVFIPPSVMEWIDSMLSPIPTEYRPII